MLSVCASSIQKLFHWRMFSNICPQGRAISVVFLATKYARTRQRRERFEAPGPTSPFTTSKIFEPLLSAAYCSMYAVATAYDRTHSRSNRGPCGTTGNGIFNNIPLYPGSISVEHVLSLYRWQCMYPPRCNAWLHLKFAMVSILITITGCSSHYFCFRLCYSYILRTCDRNPRAWYCSFLGE